MTIKSNKLVTVSFLLGGMVEYSCQLTSAIVTNSTADGTLVWTLCASGGGSFREVPDGLWALDLEWVSDWTTSGLNRYIATNDGTTVTATLNIDAGITGWDRTWTGSVVLKQPSDGGAARSTETSKATWNFLGVPVLTYAS